MVPVVQSYVELNGKLDHRGRVCRDVRAGIPDPFVRAGMADVLRAMDEGKTFAVLFAFAQCPWCRVALEQLCAAARDEGVGSILYVDVKTSRGVFERVDGRVTCTAPADGAYPELLERLGCLLEDFVFPADDCHPAQDMGCKRIFAPNLVAVKEGGPVGIATGSPLVKDPFAPLTDQMAEDIRQRFAELLRKL